MMLVDETFSLMDSIKTGLEMAEILLDMQLDPVAIASAVLYGLVQNGFKPLGNFNRALLIQSMFGTHLNHMCLRNLLFHLY